MWASPEREHVWKDSGCQSPLIDHTQGVHNETESLSTITAAISIFMIFPLSSLLKYYVMPAPLHAPFQFCYVNLQGSSHECSSLPSR